MKISLIHPSRGRPVKALEARNNWIEKSSGHNEILHYISIDTLDPKVMDYLKLFSTGTSIILCNNNQSVVEATNRAAEMAAEDSADYDIMVYLSDDFDCPVNWDDLIIKEFLGHIRPMLIKVDDMLQPFHVKVLTIPIMNHSLYNILGYFWHPGYKSMFVDEDLYHTSKKLNALTLCPHLKFEHKHQCVGKAENDDTYIRSAANWNQGKEFFETRKQAGFPL